MVNSQKRLNKKNYRRKKKSRRSYNKNLIRRKSYRRKSYRRKSYRRKSYRRKSYRRKPYRRKSIRKILKGGAVREGFVAARFFSPSGLVRAGGGGVAAIPLSPSGLERTRSWQEDILNLSPKEADDRKIQRDIHKKIFLEKEFDCENRLSDRLKGLMGDRNQGLFIMYDNSKFIIFMEQLLEIYKKFREDAPLQQKLIEKGKVAILREQRPPVKKKT